MSICSFCGEELDKGTGTMFVKKDGASFYFCSKRCEKNLRKLRRNPRRIKWTNDYRKLKAAGIKRLSRKEVEATEAKSAATAKEEE